MHWCHHLMKFILKFIDFSIPFRSRIFEIFFKSINLSYQMGSKKIDIIKTKIIYFKHNPKSYRIRRKKCEQNKKKVWVLSMGKNANETLTVLEWDESMYAICTVDVIFFSLMLCVSPDSLMRERANFFSTLYILVCMRNMTVHTKIPKQMPFFFSFIFSTFLLLNRSHCIALFSSLRTFFFLSSSSIKTIQFRFVDTGQLPKKANFFSLIVERFPVKLQLINFHKFQIFEVILGVASVLLIFWGA